MSNNKTLDINHPLFVAVEEAVFKLQVRNVEECIRYLRQISNAKKFNPVEIQNLIHSVATQYKSR